jgi:hypothetical protein
MELENHSLISGDEPARIRPAVENVGEEFIAWAEKYWNIKQAYDLLHKNEDSNHESAPWNPVREIFVRKINQLVAESKSENENQQLISDGNHL